MYTKEHQQLLEKYKKENKATIYEDIVANILNELHIKYIRQKGFIAKAYTCYIADFYLPKPNKLIIEIDGEYHMERQGADYYRDRFFLQERNIKTIRFTNHQVLNRPEEVIQILTRVVK